MIINLGSIGPKINLSTTHITSLVDFLLASIFFSQEQFLKNCLKQIIKQIRLLILAF